MIPSALNGIYRVFSYDTTVTTQDKQSVRTISESTTEENTQDESFDRFYIFHSLSLLFHRKRIEENFTKDTPRIGKPSYSDKDSNFDMLDIYGSEDLKTPLKDKKKSNSVRYATNDLSISSSGSMTTVTPPPTATSYRASQGRMASWRQSETLGRESTLSAMGEEEHEISNFFIPRSYSFKAISATKSRDSIMVYHDSHLKDSMDNRDASRESNNLYFCSKVTPANHRASHGRMASWRQSESWRPSDLLSNSIEEVNEAPSEKAVQNIVDNVIDPVIVVVENTMPPESKSRKSVVKEEGSSSKSSSATGAEPNYHTDQSFALSIAESTPKCGLCYKNVFPAEKIQANNRIWHVRSIILLIYIT